ncbi:pirin family protein, partial [Cyanothece sp. BG0011]|uniref:pirin family protein n=1 Tax=Cyanothece sp. BG0011 TaxID=2082950 RepID=UPI00351194F0
EFNASKTAQVHLLQIWILPDTRGLKPSYEEKHFPAEEKQGKLRLVASGGGRDDSVKINQDVQLYVAFLDQGDQINYSINSNRSLWIQVAKGSVQIHGQTINSGDGVAITQETKIDLIAISNDTEILLFDLA